MNNFKLKFKLKQHTPIIHFQHNQAGATLRATELKPKLDRFILTKLGGGNYKSGIQKAKENGWLIGNDTDKPALDYKVRINNTSIEDIPILKNKSRNDNGKKKIPFFFGNMGKDYKDGDLGLSFADNISGNIISFNNEILQLIESSLPDFFSLHNFGTRQSKGYGSFTVTSINDEKTEYNFKSDYNYFFELRFNNRNIDIDDILKKMEDVEWFYKSLRSGINLYGNGGNDNMYFKSALFIFLNSKGIQWDKKTIKKAFLDKRDETIYEARRNRREKKFIEKEFLIQYIDTQAKRHNNPDTLTDFKEQNDELDLKLWKDLLGLATTETWLSYKATITKDEAYFDTRQNKYKKKNKEKRDIDRLKSPIQFKPIIVRKNNNWFFQVFFDVISNDFIKALGKKIMISINQRYNEYVSEDDKPINKTIQNDEIVLPFPNLNNYNNKVDFFREFLNYSFSNISPNSHIVKSTNNNDFFNRIQNTLNNIYNQLKSNQNIKS